MYIAIEGIDGSGKTTLVQGLCKFLTENGVEVSRVTRPSKASQLDHAVFDILKDKDINESIAPLSRQLLHLCCEAEFQDRLSDYLAHHDVVVSDRLHLLSGWCYFMAEGGSRREGMAISHLVHQILPDLLIYVDVNPTTAMERIAGEQADEDWASRSVERLMSVRQEYFCALGKMGQVHAPRQFAHAVEVVDGNQPEGAVLTDAIGALVRNRSARLVDAFSKGLIDAD